MCFVILLLGDTYMNKNIGNNDKAIRIIAGAILFPSAVLGIPFVIPATELVINIVALIGVDLLVTGAIGSSPVYGLFGINTNKKTKVATPTKKTVAVKKTVRPAAKRRAPAKKRVVKAKPATKRRAPAKKKTVAKRKK